MANAHAPTEDTRGGLVNIFVFIIVNKDENVFPAQIQSEAELFELR